MIQRAGFFVLLGLVTLLFLFLLQPFFYAIFWAAVVAAVFHPLCGRLGRRLSPDMAAAVTMAIILVVIILPLAVVGSLLLVETVDLYNSLDMDAVTLSQKVSEYSQRISSHPYLQKLHIETAYLMDRIAEVLKAISTYIWQSIKGLTQNTIIFVAQFAIMLYTLFFFLRDGDRLLAWLVNRRLLGGGRERVLYDSFRTTTRATLKVTLIIGGIQGMLGGLLFALLDMRGALTWGVIMVGASIIPGVGCSIVWAPAGLIMILMGKTWQGFLVWAFGVFVISMVDNFLRPVLLKQDVQLHPLMIFLSTIGGIVVFGLTGFVLGPIIASLMIAFWKMYEETYGEKGETDNRQP
ncbi:MAG: AI-2E family transporter [Syntrophales bacterium]|nr:AI-2E family transporter [Syntrophales bacterium]